jgi:magnesium-transporting ATPase (P-type)
MTDNPLAQAGLFSRNGASRTRLFVTIQGVLCGLTAMVHGIYEILKGNAPIDASISATTGAFTLIPNYLFTGLAAVCVALALIVWTIGFIHKKNGATVFLLISTLLFLVGGGIGQVVFLLITWGAATRLNRPLDGWKRLVSENTTRRLAALWLPLLSTGYLFLGIGVAIWLFLTPPGTPYPGHSSAYLICWSALIIGLIFQPLTIAAGFSQDLERQHQKSREEYAHTH